MYMSLNIKNKYDLLLLKNQLCFPIYSAANRIINNYRSLLKKINLTYTQYIVMMVMWEKESVNEKDIVNALYLKSNTLAPLLKKLDEKGLVKVEKDSIDKRNIIISLTYKGKKLRDEAVDIPIEYGKNFPLNTNEINGLKNSLLKIIKWKI